MEKCFRCGGAMEPDEDTYFDSKRGIIFIRECLKCMECGEIMYTLKQTKEFQEKLKAMNLMGGKVSIELGEHKK